MRGRDDHTKTPLWAALLLAAATSASPTLATAQAVLDEPEASQARGTESGDATTTLPAAPASAADRAALNLKTIGWLLVASSAPPTLFAIIPAINCRAGRGGRGSRMAPGAFAGAVFSIGATAAIIGTIWRSRRTRGMPSASEADRRALLRNPVARGLSLALLAAGATVSTLLGMLLPMATQCLD